MKEKKKKTDKEAKVSVTEEQAQVDRSEDMPGIGYEILGRIRPKK